MTKLSVHSLCVPVAEQKSGCTHVLFNMVMQRAQFKYVKLHPVSLSLKLLE